MSVVRPQDPGLAIETRLTRAVAALVRERPALRGRLMSARARAGALHHLAADVAPALIRPRPRNLTVAVTARCNQACIGCRYGRDFMVGEELSAAMVHDLLEDAAALGIPGIRLYGGEPLLWAPLAGAVARAVELGLRPYVTTNAVLLGDRIDELHAAGLRDLTIGYYGTGETYDAYVQRRGLHRRVEASIARVRERYGDEVNLRMNWLLHRGSADVEALRAAAAFAARYRMPMQVDLVHYSLPYFTEGPDKVLQLRPEDRPAVERVVEELLRMKRESPALLDHTELGLRSIPDWLLRGPGMRVPCTKYEMLWVGADGTVQMCYVTFRLGNLHERRLRDLVFGPAHEQAARAAFKLDCPNCHCGYDERVQRHLPSRRAYGQRAGS
jgi:MoaA/NifB/PqqE/SkfB family radical SAM enzyme